MSLEGLCSNFNNREFNYRELCCCLTLIETVCSVLDHLWTQDSPIVPRPFEHKMGPYIEQGRSKTRFLLVQTKCNESRLLTSERMGRGFLGFGQNSRETLPTSIPELPIQL